ncbi:MAG: phosphonate transporter ATP-binding protein, partial [Rhizobium sp.]|nr:phosphonate transporter ATP-binding protein [Rhizobium sp.]
ISLHQVEYALKYCPRTIALKAGRVAYDGPSSALTPAFLNQIYGAECEELFLPTKEERSAAPLKNDHDLPAIAVLTKKPFAEMDRLSA